MKFEDVEILKECAIGGQHHAVGDVVTVTEDDAKDLYRMGRAQPAVLKSEDSSETDPAAAETAGKGKGKGKGTSATNGQ